MEQDHALDPPLVSAVVPAYNAAAHIEHTLRSLLSQTYPHLEIVVVDDGSDDETLERIQKIASQHHRVRVLQQSNLGVAAARNHGIQASRGEFIAPVDADDVWFPHAMERLAECLLGSEPRVGVAYGWWVTIDEEGQLDGGFHCTPIEGDVLGTLVCHNFLGNASCTMIRRSCLQQVGGYDDQFQAHDAQGCEDWDLYLRIARHYRFRVVPEFLFAYRKFRHSMSSDTARMARSHQRLLEYARARHPTLPSAFCRLSTSSFSLYLAHECHRMRRPRQSLAWLWHGFRSGPLFTAARVAFYGLLAKNLMALLKVFSRWLQGRHEGHTAGRDCSSSPIRTVQLADIQDQWPRIRLQNLIQTMLHRAVSWFPFT